MSRFLRLDATMDDVFRTIKKLKLGEVNAFVHRPVRLISLNERAAELEFPCGRRRAIPLRALRNNLGALELSKEALRQRGLL